jgi:hypothetical protein
MKKDKKSKKNKNKRNNKKVKKVTVEENIDYKNPEETIETGKLTLIEKLKLIRNCIVLLIAIAAIFVFFKNSIVVFEEIDLIVIFSSILFTLITFLLFLYFIKHMQDLKNRTVEIFKGRIGTETDNNLYKSQTPICTITLDYRIHHVGINHYFKIKKRDFVTLRRAPVTRVIVNLEIIRKD